MDPPDLRRAASIYEDLGRSCMEKKLLQMNAKSYWLQAGLCLLGEDNNYRTLRSHIELLYHIIAIVLWRINGLFLFVWLFDCLRSLSYDMI